MTDETRQAPAGECSCQALNCPQCSSAETLEPVIVRATGMIRRARLTEAELDVCMQVGLHAVYAARRLVDAQRERMDAQRERMRRLSYLTQIMTRTEAERYLDSQNESSQPDA